MCRQKPWYAIENMHVHLIIHSKICIEKTFALFSVSRHVIRQRTGQAVWQKILKQWTRHVLLFLEEWHSDCPYPRLPAVQFACSCLSAWQAFEEYFVYCNDLQSRERERDEHCWYFLSWKKNVIYSELWLWYTMRLLIDRPTGDL